MMIVLVVVVLLLLFSRWAYVRAERARRRDIAVQAERAKWMAAFLEACNQRDWWKAKAHEAQALAQRSISLSEQAALQKKIRDLHHISLN